MGTDVDVKTATMARTISAEAEAPPPRAVRETLTEHECQQNRRGHHRQNQPQRSNFDAKRHTSSDHTLQYIIGQSKPVHVLPSPAFTSHTNYSQPYSRLHESSHVQHADHSSPNVCVIDQSSICLLASKRVPHLQPCVDLNGVLVIAVHGGKTAPHAPLESLRELFAPTLSAVKRVYRERTRAAARARRGGFGG